MDIIVRSGSGIILGRSVHEEEALLVLDHIWEKGDVIEIRSAPGAHLWVQAGASIPAGEVYCPEGLFSWPVPFGEHRLAYAPEAFTQKRNVISARIMTGAELSRFRDVARNPLDLRGSISFYPHCTANVETRNESVFAARNVVDGLRFNTYHGEWPYESWGIGAREDAWCKIDFGRQITAERMALTLRADFPHDAYWVSGNALDSEGGEISFELEKTGDRQWIPLSGRTIRWLRLERMVKSDDPSAFPSLRAWEVIGKDCIPPVIYERYT